MIILYVQHRPALA